MSLNSEHLEKGRERATFAAGACTQEQEGGEYVQGRSPEPANFNSRCPSHS